MRHDDTQETTDTHEALAAPFGCDICAMGVSIVDNEIRACVTTNEAGEGTVGEPDGEWSPDTIDELAHRLAFLRTAPADAPIAEAIGYCGSVRIELTYEDSDGCYYGKVAVDGHTYSISVAAPGQRIRSDGCRHRCTASPWARLHQCVVRGE